MSNTILEAPRRVLTSAELEAIASRDLAWSRGRLSGSQAARDRRLLICAYDLLRAECAALRDRIGELEGDLERERDRECG